MFAFLVKRAGAAVIMLLVVSLLVFIGCEILPGDAAQVALGQYVTEEALQTYRTQMGLDRPTAERYVTWLFGVVQGDWGTSVVTRRSVASMLGERAGNTAMLAGITTLVAVPLALGLGLLMAVFRGSAFDRIASLTVLGISATPEFVVATLAVLFFSVKLGWFPAISYLSPGASVGQTLSAIMLPMATLVVVLAAQIARMTRAVVGNVLDQPYIEMANLKGIPPHRVVGRHALINAVGPIVNVVALNIAYLVSGVVVIETVFAYPGLAQLMINAVESRDMPVIEACAFIFCVTYAVLTLGADIITHLFDPHSFATQSTEQA